MEFTCQLQLKDLEKIIQATFPKYRQWLAYGVSVLLIIDTYFTCKHNNAATNFILIMICAIGIILIHTIVWRQKKKYVRLTIERLQEANTGDVIVYQYQLKDDHIDITNLNSHGHIEMRYDVFKYYKEITEYVIVMSRAQQFIIFNKDKANALDLKTFFKQKNPSLSFK